MASTSTIFSPHVKIERTVKQVPDPHKFAHAAGCCGGGEAGGSSGGEGGEAGGEGGGSTSLQQPSHAHPSMPVWLHVNTERMARHVPLPHGLVQLDGRAGGGSRNPGGRRVGGVGLGV